MSADGSDAANSKAISKGERLAPYRFPKGSSGNQSGRPKGLNSLRRRFREAFLEKPPGEVESLVDVVLRLARGRVGATIEGITVQIESKQQMEAIKFAAAYGFGMPEKKLDDDTVLRLANQMVQQMLEQGLREAEERRAAKALDVVEEEPNK